MDSTISHSAGLLFEREFLRFWNDFHNSGDQNEEIPEYKDYIGGVNLPRLIFTRPEIRQLIQDFVDQVDNGPLDLQELARIAIRRALGGKHFAARVQKLPAPQSQIDYIVAAPGLQEPPRAHNFI